MKEWRITILIVLALMGLAAAIAMADDPFVDVIDTNSSYGYDTTIFTLNGTNNDQVVGSMYWVNSNTLLSNSFTAASSWQIAAISLGVGSNVISAYGTNSLGVSTNDSVIVVRGGIGTGTPFIDVTSTNAYYTYDTTSTTITGTNNIHVFGSMWWTNILSGGNGTLAADSIWSVSSIALDIGANQIYVYGTNLVGEAVSNDVTITRGVAGTGVAFLDVTDTNSLLTYEVTSKTVGGTNNAQVVGLMRWTNSLTSAGGFISASTNWTIGSVAMGVGANVITVYGSNLNSSVVSDSVTFTRSSVNSSEELTVVDLISKPKRLELYNNSVKTMVIQLQNNSIDVNATGFSPYFYIASTATNRSPILGVSSWRNATDCTFAVTYTSNMIAGIVGEWIYGCGISNAAGITTFNQGPIGINPDPWR